jgi:hypothetical protein
MKLNFKRVGKPPSLRNNLITKLKKTDPLKVNTNYNSKTILINLNT